MTMTIRNAMILLAFLLYIIIVVMTSRVLEKGSDKFTLSLDYDFIVDKNSFVCYNKKINTKYNDNTILYYYCINKKYVVIE